MTKIDQAFIDKTLTLPMLTEEERDFLASIKGLPAAERVARIKAFARRAREKREQGNG